MPRIVSSEALASITATTVARVCVCVCVCAISWAVASWGAGPLLEASPDWDGLEDTAAQHFRKAKRSACGLRSALLRESPTACLVSCLESSAALSYLQMWSLLVLSLLRVVGGASSAW